MEKCRQGPFTFYFCYKPQANKFFLQGIHAFHKVIFATNDAPCVFQECQTVTEQDCQTTYVQKCQESLEDECETVIEQQCTQQLETSCDTIEEEECYTKYEEKCEPVFKVNV